MSVCKKSQRSKSESSGSFLTFEEVNSSCSLLFFRQRFQKLSVAGKTDDYNQPSTQSNRFQSKDPDGSNKHERCLVSQDADEYPAS